MELDVMNKSNETFQDYIKQERATVDLINSIGHLMYSKGIELVLFRNTLVDCSVSEILNLHRYAKEMVNKPISIYDSSEIARELMNLDLAPSKLDIGRLSNEWYAEKEKYQTKAEFLKNTLRGFMGSEEGKTSRDVVLYGFGRIGRLAARELIKQAGKGQQLMLKAIVTRSVSDTELIKRAALLRNDSVHGPFAGSIEEDVKNKCLIINGQRVEMIEAKNPEDIDYTAYGFKDVVIVDNTGVFKDREALSRHLKAKGVSKVILTAPGKEIPNIVYGVNHRALDLDVENIYSAASCTTNAIVPILKVIEDTYGIEKGHIETVHAYTNDQNLLDNMHKNHRRGRSAAINMVITETGAGKAVTKVIPQLKDKLTANAVRVPTPNGSLAIMNLHLNKNTDIAQLNEVMKRAALEGDLVNQINFAIEPELVSSDIIGNSCCSVYDSKATIVSPDGRSVVLYVWYDNEFGYTKQVIRLAKYIAKVRRLIYY